MSTDPWGIEFAEPEQRWHDRESRVHAAALAEHAASRLFGNEYCDFDDLPQQIQRDYVAGARIVLDTAYPQIHTEAELDALPMGTVVISGSLVYRREHQGIGRRSGIDVGTRYVWRLAFTDSHKPVLHDSATLAAVGPWTVVRQQVAS